jgi:phosphatidylserine/phosphatidylglycerophosphate/cardiolipin synthase-like enzyme
MRIKKYFKGNFSYLFFFSLIFFCLLALFSSSSTTLPSSNGDINVYFCHLHDCNAIFTDALTSSTSASCAFFDLQNKELENVLKKNNVALVLDEDSKQKPKTNNFFLRTGDGLMHNKFCIINNSFIITGSYNPTHSFSLSADTTDYNTVITIESDALAKIYLRAHKQLHKKNKVSSSQNKILHNDFLIEAYFCPQDDCQSQVLRIVNSANESIDFALFTFTDKEVSALLKTKHELNMSVSGIVESYQSKTYNQYYPLKDAGLPILLESSPRLQHTKLFVVDEKILIIGSYNPTIAATSINDENILTIHNKGIAQVYVRFIQEMMSISSLS